MGARTVTEQEWRREGAALFGPEQLIWRFRCPSCGHVATPTQWMLAGAPNGAIAFSCVGRWEAVRSDAFSGKPGPCNYAGGGLIGLNQVEVRMEDGSVQHLFEFDRTAAS